MTRRIVVMVECEACEGTGVDADFARLRLPCCLCDGSGETSASDLSAKAQKVLEAAADDDGAWAYHESGDAYCRYCEVWASRSHHDGCPHVLAKEVLGG